MCACSLRSARQERNINNDGSARALLARLWKLYRVLAFGPTEGYRCGLRRQAIREDGWTDETIAELGDAGLIERYGKILTACALTDKAIDMLQNG